MKAVCPKSNKHKRFGTTAHEVHDWEVDETGDFIRDLGCSEVAHKPDRGNIWNCMVCGAEAKFVEETSKARKKG